MATFSPFVFSLFSFEADFPREKILGQYKNSDSCAVYPARSGGTLVDIRTFGLPPSFYFSFPFLFLFFHFLFSASFSPLSFPFSPLFLCSFEYIFLAVFFFVLSALSPSSCHRTTVQKNQEFRRRHCANCSSFCSFIHTAHSFAFTLCSAALIHLLAR